MALKQLPSGLHRLAPAMHSLAPVTKADRSRERDARLAWRKWYKTARWQRLRWDVLVRDLFTCQMCGVVESDTSQLVGDHIKPHRGDRVMFFDPSNIQCLCKPCHDSDKQRAENAQTPRGGGV